MTVLTVFLCFTIISGELLDNHATMVQYCASNESGKDCSGLAATSVVNQLSELSNITDVEVRIHLTNGTHLLTENFNFSDGVNHIELQGSANKNVQLGTRVLCKNATGLYFSVKQTNVSVSRIHFDKCNREYNRAISPIALNFLYVDFLALNSVAISNSSGFGLHAFNCKQQVIHNATFERNMKGNAKIAFSRYKAQTNVYLSITNSTFSVSSTVVV